MKFNDGYWLLRQGVTAAYAKQAFAVETSESEVSIAVLTRPVEHRGSHLNTPTITVDVASPATDVVSIRASRRTRTVPPTPAFELNRTTSAVTVESDGDHVSLRAGGLTAQATVAGPWGLAFRSDDRELAAAGPTALASMQVVDDPTVPGTSHMMQRLTLPVGTNVYGLGERFGTFVKNGQSVDTWNQDGGTASEQAYKTVPFFVTDAGFGIFVNSPGRVSFEVCSEVVSAIQFSVPGDELEYLVIYGPTPREIVEKYAALTGRPALPPRWSFGLWLSTSFLTDYDEATVTHFVDGMQEREIPLSVVHFDCYWMKPLQWCDFEWDRDAFPDPEGMLQQARREGSAPQRVDQPLPRAAVSALPGGRRGRSPRCAGRTARCGSRTSGSPAWPWSTSPTRRLANGSPARCEPSSTPGSTPSRPTSGSASPSTWCGTTAPTRF